MRTTRQSGDMRCALVAMAISLSGMGAGHAGAAVVFDWATVGDPGNAPNGNRGRVTYEYRIARHEVTNAQYAEFLNSVAATDLINLYNPSMGSDARGGITRSGTAGSYSYSVKTNMAQKPVNYVSWIDAARFINWLHNGQGNGDTEHGVYDINDGRDLPGLTEVRSEDARYFLPNTHEWFKAAWFEPRGDEATYYWLYPTRSNTAPTAATADANGAIANPGENVANYDTDADWNGLDGNLTDVGSAGPQSTSYYGTFDQGGNVSEWTESLVTLFGHFHPTRRAILGGSWHDDEAALSNTWNFGGNSPSYGTRTERDDLGFRVATIIPEPASLALLAAGAAGALTRRRR